MKHLMLHCLAHRFIAVNTMCVPDKRSRVHEVVVVRRLLTWILGIWSGEGMGRVEQGEVSLSATWDQSGQDPVTARRVSK